MIIEEIVSQHTEEAAFLWLLRNNAVHAPHYNLKDLADLEERVEAHIDGLRVAGEEGWPFCEEGLKHEEVGEVFAAGFIALDSNRKDWLAPVLGVVGTAPETSKGLISALGWMPQEKLQGHVVEWLKSDNALHREIGLGACAVHRVDCGSYLDQSIADEDACVRARALRNVGEVRQRDLSHLLVEHLTDKDERCRFRAAWSATLLGSSQGLASLQAFVVNSKKYREQALHLALRAMDTAASIKWVRELNQEMEFRRLVIKATGIIGDPVSIPWLIDKMKEPEMARVAGEAVSMITGLDLAYEDLETDWPEGFEAGPSENPEDENVALDPDEDLPWPAPDLLSRWWAEHQHNYARGWRYLCGQPINRETCLDVLKSGFQRQRRAAALDLALLSPGEPLFNISAPAKRQMQLLGLES